MVDLTEIEALKASVRGAVRAAAQLGPVGVKVEDIQPHGDIADTDLDELQRLSLANALAAQALRGFVESMLKRRGRVAVAAAEGAGGIDE
jgi:hypothetical protein